MKWLILAIAFAAMAWAEGDVFVLTDENYEETLKKNPVVMVKFYAPWCGHCKSFAPEYEKAAKQVKEEGKPYILADLDATVHKNAAEKEGIQGFPTIKLFINGKPLEYSGDRTAEAVLNFIDKKTSPPSTELKTVDEIKAKKDGKGLRCIFVLGDDAAMTEYVEVAKAVEDYTYYHAPLNLVKEVFPEAAANNVVLIKDFDEGKAIYTEAVKADKLTEFLQSHMLPTVTEITQKVIEQVFRGSARKGVFLFRDASSANAKDIEAEFRKLAVALKSKEYVFVQSDIKEGWGQRVANFFGLEEASLPVLEIVQTKEEIIRYRHSGAITEAEMKTFMENFAKGTLPRYLKSEPEPTENPGPVYKLVGKSFKSMVLDNDDDVIVKFYAPWCGHCKKMAPIYVALAESLASNKKLKFMEIDSTKNDVEGHPIQGFPVVKFFPGKDKSNPHTYDGDRSEGDLAKFIKEKSSYAVDMPELKAKDEGEKNKDDL